MIAWNI